MSVQAQVLSLLAALVSGALAASPLRGQTAHFNGAVATVYAAQDYPNGLAVDASGNLYVTLGFGTDEVLELSPGCIPDNYLYQGNSTNAFCTTTKLGGGWGGPFGVAVDGNGNVYVADQGSAAVYKMPPNCTSQSCMTALGGGFVDPVGVAVDGSGNVYVTDEEYRRPNDYEGEVFEIPPGCSSFSCMTTLGNDGTVPDGGWYGISAIAVDKSGNVYVTDSSTAGLGFVVEMPPGCTTTRFDNGDCTITTLGSSFSNAAPAGVAVDSDGNVYVTDVITQAVYEMPPGCASSSCVSSVAGSFGFPLAIAVDNGSGNVYVTNQLPVNGEVFTEVITRQAVSAGTTPAGTRYPFWTLNFTFTAADSGITASVLTEGGKGLDFIDYGTGSCDTNGTSHAYSAGDTCGVDVSFRPLYPGARNGAVQLSDANGVIATAYIYGTGTGPQLVFAPATRTVLAPGENWGVPNGVAVDSSGNIYVAGGNGVMEMPPGCASTGCVTALGGGFSDPAAAALDGAGNVYIADSNNNAVTVMPPGCASSNCVTALGGGFSHPHGVAVDGAGNVYVGDSANNAVKEIPAGCASSSCVSTLGGGLSAPYGVAVDASGNVFVADEGSSAVKEIPLGCTSANCVTTLGGGFDDPYSVAVDGGSNVYVADYNNNAVKKIPPACASSSCVTTLSYVPADRPSGVAVDGSGNVYAAHQGSSVVDELNFATPPNLSFASTNIGSSSSNSVTLWNIGSAALTFPFEGTGGNPSATGYFSLDASTTCPVVTQPSSNGVIAAGASCNLAVDFAPIYAGPISGTLELIDTNLNITYTTQTIALSGTGVTPPLITPTVTVTPAQSTITTAQPLSVTITVSGGSGNPIPTGSITLTGNGNYGGSGQLTGGSVTIDVPQGDALPVGSDTLVANYTPDSGSSSIYNNATGMAPVMVVQAIGSCSTSNPNPNPNPAVFAAVQDFNGDCMSDILWQNSSTQQVYEWLMNGTTIASSGSPYTPTSDWVIQGVGDFDGDGKSDILWRNTNSGEVYIWLMNGTTIASSGSPYTLADPTWVIQGVGDFDGDGKSDILWRNTTTGEVYIWLMNGITIKSSGSPYTLADSTWVIQGVGDFDGDGNADILWRNTSTGEVYIWLMNGTTIKSSGSPYTLADSTWVIQGVGDFDGDGKSDILWRNSDFGEVYIWLMNGTAIASSGSPYTLADSTWVIQGTGDYDGSGRSGILWHNNTTGQVYIWLMNGTTVTSSQSPGTPAAVWQVEP